MKYSAAVLTHGDATTLTETVTSFNEMVRPAPATMLLAFDGPTEKGRRQVDHLELESGFHFDEILFIHPQGGFCAATEELWMMAGTEHVDYIFWLESDFTFNRIVELKRIAAVLKRNPDLAQMSLMRDPQNEIERAGGGLVGSHPDWFEHHDGYMSQRVYYSTNPSLIPIDLIRSNRWPLEPACEGLFSHHLMRDPKTRFGVWGNGEEWVKHIGQRTGFGY